MGFFSNLFGGKESAGKTPSENNSLTKLITIYNNNKDAGHYQTVMDEIGKGFARLLLPTEDAEDGTKTSGEKDLELTSVSDVDGLVTLFVFTSKKHYTYRPMKLLNIQPYAGISKRYFVNFGLKVTEFKLVSCVQIVFVSFLRVGIPSKVVS
jgi:hypothetical protein